MHCKKGLTSDFLDSTFSKGFRRGELRKAKARILCELEKSLLPDTMQVLIRQKKHHRYAVLLSTLRASTDMMLDRFEVPDGFLDNLAEAKELKSELVQTKRRTDRTIKCPTEDCRGYIPISRTGTCELCMFAVCRTCGLQKRDDTHACTADDIATYTLLKESCKQCPKCGTLIERVSGCSQMFCISCHSAFDWNTLKLLTGPVHNPHYFEFLRTRSVQGLVANACNEDFFGLYDIIPNAFNTTIWEHPCAARAFPGGGLHECTRPDCLKRLHFFEMWQVANWILAEIAHPVPGYSNTSYEHLRMRFLRNRLSERDWITQLSSAETRRTKQQRLHEINVMFATVSRDLALRLVETIDYVTFAQGMEELRVYTLTEKRRILDDYSDRAVRHPDEEWRYIFIPK